MANFHVTGDDFIDQFRRIPDEFQSEAVRAVLTAGAEVVVESWQSSIAAHGHVRSGSMLQNVGMTNWQLDIGKSSVEVYPLGSDGRGVRNAEKAYIIHYGYGGKKTKKTGDRYVTEAERNAMQRAHDAQQQALDEFIKSKGL